MQTRFEKSYSCSISYSYSKLKVSNIRRAVLGNARVVKLTLLAFQPLLERFKATLHEAIFLATCLATNVARQVSRKISRVTPHFCNLQRKQNIALRVARKVEISSTVSQPCETSCCVWHANRNLQNNFVKMRQSEFVFRSQEISSWRRKSCNQFPAGELQVAKKYCERVTTPLQLAMFFCRHRCETSCKKNCPV